MIQIFFVGNIGRNADLKTINGRQVIEFSIAHTEKKKDAAGVQYDETTWATVSKWIPEGGSTALHPYLTQGTKVAVTGKVKAHGYAARENNVDGSPQIRAELRIMAENIELCGGGQTQQQAQPAYSPQATPPPPPQQPAGPAPTPVFNPKSGKWEIPTQAAPQVVPPQQPGGAFDPRQDLPF